MKGLLYGVAGEPQPPPPDDANHLLKGLAATPMALMELDEPALIGPDWLVLQTRLTGICGSDSKQVFMDVGPDPADAMDNCMTALISFPQVLGHEVVATVVQAGPDAAGVAEGQRVVLNPWLSCRPRGITPVCPACEVGDLSLCWSFTEGRLSPGIHTGNATEATGGFAERLPAHDTMVIPVPDGVPDEAAVLADPFSVSLHAVLQSPPPASGRAVVYGAGALGTTTTAVLRTLYPEVEVLVIARHPAQAELARKMGAATADPEPIEQLVDELARWSGATMHQAWQGLPFAHPGHIDVVYDTIGSPQTIEVGIRMVKARGAVVVTGVASPGRFEWTPLYFKEIRIIGSNAFGIEELDGKRQHAIAHYLEMVDQGRIDITPMLTHRFRLDEWRDAFTTLATQGQTGAIKVAFDFR